MSKDNSFKIEWLYFYHVLPQTVNLEDNSYLLFNKNTENIYQLLIHYPCLRNKNTIKYDDYKIDRNELSLLSINTIYDIFKNKKKNKNLFLDLKNLMNEDNRKEYIKISRDEKKKTIFKCVPLKYISEENKYIIAIICYNNNKIPQILSITKNIKYQFLTKLRLTLKNYDKTNIDKTDIDTKRCNIFKNINFRMSNKEIFIDDISILEIIKNISLYYSALEINITN